jgi:phosphoglycerate dehydrogenase-like enzyme
MFIRASRMLAARILVALLVCKCAWYDARMAKLLLGLNQLDEARLRELQAASRDLEVVCTGDKEEISRISEEIEVAARVSPSLVAHMPNLKWYHNWFAGVEHLVDEEPFASGRVLLSNASGTHAEPMAQQFFAMLLSWARNLPAFVRAQDQHDWLKGSMEDVFELDGLRLLVVGLGAIGQRIAELGAAFGMSVVGVRRNPADSDGIAVVGPDKLMDELATADVVVNVAPLTPETNGLFDRAAFEAMKPTCIFSNLGRGKSVDQDALVAALRERVIAGALLDVTEPEPLPSDSPLWGMQNVLISPHTGGWTPRYLERTWPIFIENVRRYVNGSPLINRIDVTARY